jgi:hypothetical protein
MRAARSAGSAGSRQRRWLSAWGHGQSAIPEICPVAESGNFESSNPRLNVMDVKQPRQHKWSASATFGRGGFGMKTLLGVTTMARDGLGADLCLIRQRDDERTVASPLLSQAAVFFCTLKVNTTVGVIHYHQNIRSQRHSHHIINQDHKRFKGKWVVKEFCLNLHFVFD